MANYQLQTRLFEDFAGDLLQAAEANSNMVSLKKNCVCVWEGGGCAYECSYFWSLDVPDLSMDGDTGSCSCPEC